VERLGGVGPHAGQPVRLAGPALADADRAMIVVHGRGATAESILELGRVLTEGDTALLAPQAAGYTWYPASFMAPLASNQPFLDSGLAGLGALVDEVAAAGIPAERTILAGFSQGACLSSEFVARNPKRWGGLLVFSGGLIGPEGMDLTHEGDLEGTPVFMGCSDRDFHIPLSRFEATGAELVRMGAEVDLEVYPDMGHTIVKDEVDRARRISAPSAGP
jgi:predicted esterase